MPNPGKSPESFQRFDSLVRRSERYFTATLLPAGRGTCLAAPRPRPGRPAVLFHNDWKGVQCFVKLVAKEGLARPADRGFHVPGEKWGRKYAQRG